MKKILYIVFSVFIILVLSTITNISNNNVLRTNFEIDNVTHINNTKVYLLNDNYFIEVGIFIDNIPIKDKAEKIIEYLKISDNNTSSFKGYIPKNTKINNIEVVDKTLYIDFSKELLDMDSSYLKGLIKSLLNINEVEKVSIKVNNKELDNYKGEIEDIQLNSENNFHNRKDINKVEVFYYKKVNNELYNVPVTKYLNDNRDKLDIIVEELKEKIPSNLISYYDLKIKSYEQKNDTLTIDVEKLDDKSVNQITKSIFSSTSIETIIFKENNKIKKIVNRNE